MCKQKIKQRAEWCKVWVVVLQLGMVLQWGDLSCCRFQLISRSYFLLSQQLYQMMRTVNLALAALLLITLVNSQTTATRVTSTQGVKKGLTLQATVWPSYNTNWAGRVSCNNCNPFQGDQFCNISLPLFCISYPKTLVRPLYSIPVQYTPFSVLDGGYYEGWTGGVIQATLPVMGSAITSYKVGDNICKGYFGSNSNFATFNSGFYMAFMNQSPIKAWASWDWKKTTAGGWNFWGYFNMHYRGRGWAWSSNQANGNCGA